MEKLEGVNKPITNVGFEFIEAMEEAKRISKAPETKNYCSFREALEEIEE